MCMSPGEMSSKEIEDAIDDFRRRISKDPSHYLRSYWEGTIENLEAVLKERADDGTYDADHTDRSGTATARQDRATR